jgi:sigma54-dependent transcription regulator
MMNILISWIGATDLRAQKESHTIGFGPIAQAVIDKQYDKIILISDYAEEKTDCFKKWLQSRTEIPVTLHHFTLTSPTDFGEIYHATTTVISSLLIKYTETASLTFHLSPGTPAMAAVWVILAKTRFPAELIESSRQYGVRTVSIPFDISADFIPNLLRKPDKTLQKLFGQHYFLLLGNLLPFGTHLAD